MPPFKQKQVLFQHCYYLGSVDILRKLQWRWHFFLHFRLKEMLPISLRLFIELSYVWPYQSLYVEKILASIWHWHGVSCVFHGEHRRKPKHCWCMLFNGLLGPYWALDSTHPLCSDVGFYVCDLWLNYLSLVYQISFDYLINHVSIYCMAAFSNINGHKSLSSLVDSVVLYFFSVWHGE